MAVTAIWSVKGSVGKVLRYVANPAKTWNGQYAEAAKFHTVERVLEYDADAMKTEKQYYVTGINCSDSPASAAEQFRATKETWKKPGGIVCFHGYQSFEAGEVTPDIAHEIGVKLAKQLWGDRFQVVVSTHTNTGKIHNHFCLNSVSFTDAVPNNIKHGSATRTALHSVTRYGRTSTLCLNMRRASDSFKSRFRTGDIFWNTAGAFSASDRTRERNSFALIGSVTDIPRMRYGSDAAVITKTDRARFAWHLFTKSGSAQRVSWGFTATMRIS